MQLRRYSCLATWIISNAAINKTVNSSRLKLAFLGKLLPKLGTELAPPPLFPLSRPALIAAHAPPSKSPWPTTG